MVQISLREILSNTRKSKYGIPCLAGSNLEILMGSIKAAEEKQAPVIICYNKQLSPGIPPELLIPLIVQAAKYSEVPICTILDHGFDFDLIMKAIQLGLSSIMYDGSRLSFEENVVNTKEMVKIAHSLGVSIEAELGGVGGSVLEISSKSPQESFPTDPEQAVEFVERTGIDALAISFGNVHGKYYGEPKIDLGLVKRIVNLIDIPLVMHGASGLPMDAYKDIINSGISKINYFSSMCRGSYDSLKNLIDSSDGEAFCIHAIPALIEFWKTETEKLLDLFMCSGRASDFKKMENKQKKYNTDNLDRNIIDIISDNIYKEIKKFLI